MTTPKATLPQVTDTTTPEVPPPAASAGRTSEKTRARVEDLRPHPRNPRTISAARLEQLQRTLAAEPDLLEARPIIALPISLDANVLGGHSTQKPVETAERAIRNHTGDVYDPFAGTGTTLIAAERERRRCFAMEIDPACCDVIRQRYADYVGDQSYAP